MLSFSQFAEMQRQMTYQSSSGPSGNVNPFDNVPMGMRSTLGRGTPDTIFAQAIQRIPTIAHQHETHINSDNGQVVTFDWVYAAQPKVNPGGNGNFMSRPHQSNIMSFPDFCKTANRNMN